MSFAQLVSRFGDVVQLFDENGWLKRGPKAQFVRCRLCNEGHDAELSFDGETGHGYYWCVVSGGRATADEAELEMRVVALECVLPALRDALAPIKFSLREEIPGVLWLLGESTRCGLAWTAMLARAAHNDNLALILERLPRVSAGPGLVLTSTPTPPMLDSGPFRLRPIATIMDLDVDGILHVNESAIKAGLGIARDRRRGRGRPADFETEALAVIAAASVEELNCDDAGLLDLVRSRLPGLETKSHGVIAETLKKRIIEAANERCLRVGSQR
ncbi:MAG: hypothetical protein KF779_14590 [Hyphomonadaceae bacterium]|nr:hypothetical protein [Hyphomonadaceae bacterium]